MKLPLIKPILLIFALFFVTSCSTIKKVKQEESKVENKYSSFTSRYQGSYNGIPFKVQIRAKHDSILWFSVSAFSMDAGRALITKDSLFVMDKINKQIYKRSKKEVYNLLNNELDNVFLEQLILDTIPFEKQLKIKTSPSIEVNVEKSYEGEKMQRFKIEAILNKSKHIFNLLQEGLEYDKTQQYPFNIPSSFKVN